MDRAVQDPPAATNAPVADLRRRAAAWLIDAACGGIAAYLLVATVGGSSDVSTLLHLVAFKSVPGPAGHALSAAVHPGQAGLDALRPVAGLLALLTVLALVAVAYRVVTTALWGAGFGKWVLGLRVVVDGGVLPGAPGWSRSWRRWLVPQGPGLIPLPGTGLFAYLPALRDPRRRGLHDRAAGTVVVDIRPRPAVPALVTATLAPLDGYADHRMPRRSPLARTIGVRIARSMAAAVPMTRTNLCARVAAV